jgi:tRNA A-37 threonylcarbamoyl transferase component Bud32
VRRDSIIGQVVADRFKVLSLLGEGGTGQVYLAEHDVLEREFAIKVLRRDLISDQTAAERFRREARAASRMEHRNIVYINDFGGLDDGRLYLVMEYIPGEELSTVINADKRLPARRAARILVQVADALEYAHGRGVVHRDLKAENILLTTERQRTDVVKILDFGLAKILFGAGNLDTITFKGQVFGTPEYIPPEQIVGDPVDQRADIYAMGVLACELVTGRTPFLGSLMELLVAHRKLTPPVPTELASDAGIPRCFDDIVARAMQKRPDDRFQRASEIGQILRRYLTETAGAGTDASRLASPVHEAAEAAPPAATDSALAVAPEPSRPVAEDPAAGGASGLRVGAGIDSGGSEPCVHEDAALPRVASLEPERLQQRRHALYQLVGALRDHGLASDELAQRLIRARQLEEQQLEAETELSLLQARLEQLEATGREQESQLRYAVIDLSMERDRLERVAEPSPGQQAMLADLVYQIQELEHRLLDVARKREQQLDDVDRQIIGQRRAWEDAQAALTREDQALRSLVEACRGRAVELPSLAEAYQRLAALEREGSQPGQGR